MNRSFRPLLPLTIAAAMLATATAPAAAQTFRIVGADGRVTYSDRRPTDPALQVSELGHAAPPAPASGAKSTAKGNAKGAGANSNAKAEGLGDAVADVMARQYLVQAMSDFCAQMPAETASRLDGMAAAWRQRNAPMIKRTDRVMFAAFTPDQRAQIHSTAQARLEPVFVPLGAAIQIKKIAWCEKSADDLASGALDLVTETRLSAPIMGYTPP